MNKRRVKRPKLEEGVHPLVIGWREWMALPELNIPAIKVKADTGARTSALHAMNIVPFEKDGRPFVRFDVEPVQGIAVPRIACEAPVVDQRTIKDSGGHTEVRYVVEVLLKYKDRQKLIELTLTHRQEMRFRMLLGRSALMPDMLVDPGASYRLARFSRKEIKSGEH